MLSQTFIHDFLRYHAQASDGSTLAASPTPAAPDYHSITCQTKKVVATRLVRDASKPGPQRGHASALTPY